MKEHKKILLIHKILTKEASLEEISFYDSWIKENQDNQALANDIKSVWVGSKSIVKNEVSFDKKAAKAKLFEQIEGINHKADTLVINSPSKPKVFNLYKALSIAAVFVIVLGSVFFLNNFLNNKTSYNSSDIVSFYNLPDNSKIWLDKDSELKLNENFNVENRDVSLIGSAHFDIKENQNLPFKIEVLNNKIEVLGTSFMVYSVPDEKVGVNVYKGVVKLTNEKNESVTLKNGEGAESLLKSNSIERINGNEFENDFKKEYLTFNDSPLELVFFRLSNYFDIKIEDKCGKIQTMNGFTSPQHAGDSESAYFSTIERLYNVKIEKLSSKTYRIKCD